MGISICTPRGVCLRVAITAAALLLFTGVVAAQNTVVVIPLQGDDVVRNPSFRIVPDVATGEAATSGRLEFTADANPGPASNWGKVCDDCFEGDNSCPTTPPPSTHAAAHAVCRDLGYATGFVNTSGPNATGSLGFSLDDVVCPDGAASFSDCTSRAVNTHNCSSGEEVTIECTVELPRVVIPGATLNCALGFSNPGSNDFTNLNDTDPLNPVVEDTASEDTLLLRWSFIDDPFETNTVSVRILAIPALGPNYDREVPCDGSPSTIRGNESFTIQGETGLTWRVSTTISEPSAGVLEIGDITIELVP